MTDRELLEMAAKAAGIKIERFRLDDPMWRDVLIDTSSRNEKGDAIGWNPLTDDGDALRLAVKLNLTVKIWISAVVVEEYNGKRLAYEDTGCRAKEYEYEATRRAIVRAAAAIGESMK